MLTKLPHDSLRFLDENSQMYSRKLSDRTISARKRRERPKRQVSYAILTVLHCMRDSRGILRKLYIESAMHKHVTYMIGKSGNLRQLRLSN